MQTLSQQRAAKALELIVEIGKSTANNEKERKDFEQLSKSVPTMILQNGLGQVVAFLKAKNEPKHNMIYDVLNKWLKSMGKIEKDLLVELNKMDSHNYIAVQIESLRFLEWVKRYASGNILG